MRQRIFFSKFTALATIVALCTTGCFLFSGRSTPQLSEIPLFENGIESGFEADPTIRNVYRSRSDQIRVTALEECDEVTSASGLTRTRQLFVGFKEVKLPSTTTIEVAGYSVQKTTIDAALDDIPLSVVTYSLRGSQCAYDIVLWTQDHPKNGERVVINDEVQRHFEGLLQNVLPGLVR